MGCKERLVKEKGITLAETVISMALVILFAFVAFTTISVTSSANEKNNLKNFMTVSCQNIVKAYESGAARYSDSMQLLVGENFVYGEDAIIYYTKTLELSDNQDYAYYIEIKFGERFQVMCYNFNDKLIISTEV